MKVTVGRGPEGFRTIIQKISICSTQTRYEKKIRFLIKFQDPDFLLVTDAGNITNDPALTNFGVYYQKRPQQRNSFRSINVKNYQFFSIMDLFRLPLELDFVTRNTNVIYHRQWQSIGFPMTPFLLNYVLLERHSQPWSRRLQDHNSENLYFQHIYTVRDPATRCFAKVASDSFVCGPGTFSEYAELMYFRGPDIQFVIYNNERSRNLPSIYIGTARIIVHYRPISNTVIHRIRVSKFKCYISASRAGHMHSNDIDRMELRVVRKSQWAVVPKASGP